MCCYCFAGSMPERSECCCDSGFWDQHWALCWVVQGSGLNRGQGKVQGRGGVRSHGKLPLPSLHMILVGPLLRHACVMGAGACSSGVGGCGSSEQQEARGSSEQQGGGGSSEVPPDPHTHSTPAAIINSAGAAQWADRADGSMTGADRALCRMCSVSRACCGGWWKYPDVPICSVLCLLCCTAGGCLPVA